MHRSGVSAYPSRIVPPLLSSPLLSLSLWFCPSFPFRLAILQNRGGSLLFYLLTVGVCACVNVCAYAGDAADAGDDDQGDE